MVLDAMAGGATHFVLFAKTTARHRNVIQNADRINCKSRTSGPDRGPPG